MNNVNTTAFMLGMLAIGGLIAGGAMFTGQQASATIISEPNVGITVSPVNAAAASNSDDDVVIQGNEAEVKQEGKVECKASVEDNDFAQVGDNTNAAGNDCGVAQSSSISQSNSNEDNDIQVAEATACQSVALLVGANICDNLIEVDVLGGGDFPAAQ